MSIATSMDQKMVQGEGPAMPPKPHVSSGQVLAEAEANTDQMEGNLRLRDGGVIHMRPIRAEDTSRLQAFHAHLSPETIAFRFFHYMPQLSTGDAQHFTHVDYDNRMALVAIRGAGVNEEILGVVRYDRIGPCTAEVAFVVADAWQGHGIATALLHQLASYARTRGITTFTAVTMPNNRRMLQVFQQCGFPCESRYQEGDMQIQLDIRTTPYSSSSSGKAT